MKLESKASASTRHFLQTEILPYLMTMTPTLVAMEVMMVFENENQSI